MKIHQKSGLLALGLVGILAAMATNVSAQSGYEGQATLISPTAKTSAILDGALWSCSDQTCQAVTVSGSVPASIACKRFVVAFGAVSSFTYAGKTLGADKLAVCNSAANN